MSRRADVARAAGAALVLLAACGTPQDYMTPSGTAAREIAALGWTVLVLFIVTTIVVWGLIAWVATRRRGTLDEHAPVDASGGQLWILIGGILVPGAVFAAIFVMTLRTMAAFPMEEHGDPPEIRVLGHQWWWEVHYLGESPQDRMLTANELHVPVGRPVSIALESTDVIHSFWVPKLHGKVDLIPGMTNHIRIEADTPGVYRGECGEYCGEQHAHMVLHVVAEPAEAFDVWLRAQRAPGAEPTSDEARHGRDVFLNGACPLCHRVAGTAARGAVAPDLTHVASRSHIAGWLPNDTADLEAWITHAQSLKPGARMPDLRQFSGRDLRALTAYVQSLR